MYVLMYLCFVEVYIGGQLSLLNQKGHSHAAIDHQNLSAIF